MWSGGGGIPAGVAVKLPVPEFWLVTNTPPTPLVPKRPMVTLKLSPAGKF